MKVKLSNLSILFYCLSFFFVVVTKVTATEKQTKDDLNQIQQELKNKSHALTEQQQKIIGIEKILKTSELSIAENAKALNELTFSIELNKNEQIALQQQIATLDKDIKAQQTILASQLKSAFMTGSHDYSKLLLNQEKVSSFERTLTYYSYLNQARAKQLDTLKNTLLLLADKKQQLAATHTELSRLVSLQKQKQLNLIAAQKNRKTSLTSLQVQLKNTQDNIDYLKQNEQILIDTLNSLAEQVKQEFELTGLVPKKGKLNWPSAGRLRHKFGQRKHGKLTWKGVVIKAKQGATVSSIQNGQVVFADWLKGFGWVIVIDHGEGYMSLYGHNQALLKDVGEQVSGGEIIALVGQSGGQSNPGLYFEIRHKGRAVNPKKWCRRI